MGKLTGEVIKCACISKHIGQTERISLRPSGKVLETFSAEELTLCGRSRQLRKSLSQNMLKVVFPDPAEENFYHTTV